MRTKQQYAQFMTPGSESLCFVYKLRLIVFLLLALASKSVSGQLYVPDINGSAKGEIIDSDYVARLLDRAKSYYDSEWNYKNKIKIDSAKSFLVKALKISRELNIVSMHNRALIGLGEYYFRCDSTIKASYFFEKAIGLSEITGALEMQAQTWYAFADRTPPIDTLISKKVFRYQQSNRIYEILRNVDKQIFISQCIARTYLDHRDFVVAEKQLNQILNRQRKIKHSGLSFTFDMLAIVEGSRGNYNNAIKWDLEALNDPFLTDVFLKSRIHFRIARWYRELGSFRSAIDHNLRAMEIMTTIDQQDVHEKFFCYVLLRQIIQGMITLNKPDEALKYLRKTNMMLSPKSDFARQYVFASIGDCYGALKKYGLAEANYLAAIQQASLNGRPEDQPNEYLLLAGMSIKWQRYDKARIYIDMFLSFSKQTHDIIKLKEVHYIQFKIDSAAGNLLSAIKHLEISKMLNDSIFTERKSKQIEELLVQYETSQKEKNILTLKTNARLQQKELEKAGLTRKLILGTLVLLLLVSAFLFYAYSAKKKSNQILQLQQFEISRKNNSLQLLVDEKENLLNEKGELLEEKEWLLKEIHHRVKNNLQVIIGLLYSQSAHLNDPVAIKAIKESQQRIYSIGLIHQKLYQSENLDEIPMKEYIDDLVSYILSGLKEKQAKVTIIQRIGQVKLDVAQAVPIGLIINEALTNIFKYAFPAQDTGIVEICFTQNDEDYELIIKDNGIGLPHDFDPQKSSTLGITLITGMCEQLEGSCNIRNQNGVQILICFKKEKGWALRRKKRWDQIADTN
jgi:two-component sensor histidine kinase